LIQEAVSIDSLLPLLSDAPVIAAVRAPEQLQKACDARARVIFLLCGDLFTLPKMVETIRDAGKIPFVHLDLLDGVGRDAGGVRWVAHAVKPYGVLSTRVPLLKMASEQNVRTVLRMFLVDSSSVETGARMAKSAVDMVEIMPGLVTRAIAALNVRINRPIIAGGMIERAADVERALKAGAVAVSTSEPSLWTWERREENG